MFHMFKRDIKKYSNFQSYIKILETLSEVENILLSYNDLSNISVQHDDTSIVISRSFNSQNDLVEEPQENEEALEEIEEEYIDDVSYDNAEIQMRTIEDDNINNIAVNNEISYDNSYTIDDLEEFQDNSDSTKRRRKYFYKSNTNESLTDEQNNWIKEQVRNSEVIINDKKVFKCQICGTLLQISGSLKKHLRDSHVLKSDHEKEENKSKREFKDEIAKSKIIVKTENGNETIWKCLRCSRGKVFRSEGGLKVHLRYGHIRNQFIDSDFVAKCKVQIETTNGHKKDAWQCTDCQKILRSRDGLRNHMKLEHTDTVEQIHGFSSSNATDEKIIEEDHFESCNEQILFNLARKKPETELINNSCQQCGIMFFNGTTKKEKSYEIHQQLHIILKAVSKNYELPKCTECKVLFSNNEDFNSHMLTHDRNEIFPAKGLSFLVANKFKESIGSASSDDENSWKCGHCNVYFIEEIECIEHQMILHSKQLICPADFLEFSGIRGLGLFSNHMKNKHPEMFPELTIFCSYCGLEFSNVFDKLSHMKICDTKHFRCDHCEKSFFKKTQLIRHLKIVSGIISFICDICSKVT